MGLASIWLSLPAYAAGREPDRAVAVTPGVLPGDDYVRQILQRRIEVEKRSLGIAVGIIDTNGVRIITQGDSGNPARPQVDGRTLFEIGSITKTFAAALLVDMVNRGEVTLDTTVRECLPPTLRLASPGPGDITLGQLATHCSGLPRMPDLPKPKEEKEGLFPELREFRHLVRQQLGKEPPDKPVAWVHTTREQLFAWLEHHKLNPAEPHPPEYSNVGMELLGEALAQKAKRAYESLMTERVFGALGLTNTCIHAPAAWERFFAIGHTDQLEPAPRLNIPDCPGAGAISSTVNDMLIYLAANLNQTAPIDPMLHRVRARSEKMTVGLNWIIGRGKNKELVWHNGGTQGFTSFIGFKPNEKTGVVVLSNAGILVDDIGLHLLAPHQFGLSPVPPREPWLQVGADRYWVPVLLGLIGLYLLAAPIEAPGGPGKWRWLFGEPLSCKLELAEILLGGCILAAFAGTDISRLLWGPAIRPGSLALFLVMVIRFALKGRHLPWFKPWSRLEWFGHGLALVFVLVGAGLSLVVWVFF